MDFNINNFDLLVVAAGIMTYAIGAAIWTCLEVPASLLREPASQYALDASFHLERNNEFL